MITQNECADFATAHSCQFPAIAGVFGSFNSGWIMNSLFARKLDHFLLGSSSAFSSSSSNASSCTSTLTARGCLHFAAAMMPFAFMMARSTTKACFSMPLVATAVRLRHDRVGEGGMRSALGLEVAEIVHDLGQHRLVVDKRAVVGAEGVVQELEAPLLVLRPP